MYVSTNFHTKVPTDMPNAIHAVTAVALLLMSRTLRPATNSAVAARRSTKLFQAVQFVGGRDECRGLGGVLGGQLAAFIQQRIRHAYRRQRPTPLPSRTAKSSHQSRLGVDGVSMLPMRLTWRRCRGLRHLQAR
jgi:hypothetical protein